MGLQDVLTKVVELGGSDVFIVPGAPVTYKVRGQVVAVPGDRLTPTDTEQLLRQAYAIAPRLFDRLALKGDDDFSFSVSDVGRFRCSAYRQRGSLAASLRLVMFGLPDPKQMLVPDAVVDLYRQNNGLVLVTGAAGSGKTTTLACIVDRINSERAGHIITIEDPIEYLHPHKGCVISQREVGADTESFSVALFTIISALCSAKRFTSRMKGSSVMVRFTSRLSLMKMEVESPAKPFVSVMV